MGARAITDIGGEAAGPIDRHEHEPTMVERRIDAMMMLMRAKPRAFWGADENRRTIESLTPEFYEKSEYYERWVAAMRGLLIEKGILDAAEITAKLAEVRQRFDAARAAGPSSEESQAESSDGGQNGRRDGGHRNGDERNGDET